jgi:hypothetical protein
MTDEIMSGIQRKWDRYVAARSMPADMEPLRVGATVRVTEHLGSYRRDSSIWEPSGVSHHRTATITEVERYAGRVFYQIAGDYAEVEDNRDGRATHIITATPIETE